MRKTARRAVNGGAKAAGKGRKRTEPARMMKLSDLEQIRILADPLRVRILEALADERTTKQVAQEIGEKPTKLYHHVDALKKVGLIRLTRTRRNRGTLEKYYQVVALSFQPDASLFPRAGYAASAMEVVSNLLARAGSELQDLADCSDGEPDLEEKAVIGFVEVRAPEKEIVALRARLDTVLKDLQTMAGGRGQVPPGAQRYRLMLGFYPLMKPSVAGKKDRKVEGPRR